MGAPPMVSGYSSPMPVAAPPMVASPMIAPRTLTPSPSYQGLPGVAQPQMYVDFQTSQPVTIDTRTHQAGVADIDTAYTHYTRGTRTPVHAKSLHSHQYVPVDIQTDTYTQGSLITDNYVPVTSAAPTYAPT